MTETTIKNFRIIYTWISVLLLLVSLTQDCFCTTDTVIPFGECGGSIPAYLLGWFGVVSFYSWANMTWLANPLLFIAWIVAKKNLKSSFITSFIAFLLAISFLLCSGVVDNDNEDISNIIGYRSGYWLWMSSALVMFIGNGISYFVFEKKLLAGGKHSI